MLTKFPKLLAFLTLREFSSLEFSLKAILKGKRKCAGTEVAAYCTLDVAFMHDPKS